MPNFLTIDMNPNFSSSHMMEDDLNVSTSLETGSLLDLASTSAPPTTHIKTHNTSLHDLEYEVSLMMVLQNFKKWVFNILLHFDLLC